MAMDGNAYGNMCCFAATKITGCVNYHTENVGLLPIITHRVLLFLESVMGNSLHNKIYLGRTTVLGSRRMQGLVALSALVGICLVWLAFRSFK
jgi:hypothetical protein